MTALKLIVPFAALAGAAFAFGASPAVAQGSERVMIVYGDDPCPTSGNGDEIVVCARKPETERYRIPQELRSSVASPANASWAARATSFEYVGKSGAESCSASGGGGWTGCYAELMRKAREEKKDPIQQRGVAP